MTEDLAGRPLAGIRVVEVSAYVATPLAGLTLARLGAEVIRIEPLGGQVDRARLPRAADGTSLYWSGLNQGKRAIEVDFRSEEGRRLIADLILADGGGVVVSNTTRFPELSYDALAARRPDVIEALLLGSRDGGTAVDYTVQAGTGVPWITGPTAVDGPVNEAVPYWDVLAGLYLALGVVSAVHERSVTGRGRRIEVALQDVAMATIGTLGLLADAQVNEHPRARSGNDVYGMLGRDFATRDGHVMMVVLTDRHWKALIEVTGIEPTALAIEASLGVSFAAEEARYEYRDVIFALLEPWFAARTTDAVVDELSRAGLLASPYRDLAGLAADDARLLAADPLFSRVSQPGVAPHYAAGAPLVFDRVQVGPETAPAVGAHTDAVLGEVLGHSGEAVAELRRRGVIGGDR